MKVFFFTIIAIFFFVSAPTFAAVMGSTNYKLQNDSVNFGGGLGSSTNYTQESTFGEVSTGNSSSTSYRIHAGYQQMVATYLSISVSPVTLTPTIPTAGGGAATGSTAVTVATDDPAGYNLYITASSSPALVSGSSSFADYVPAGADPDFAFTVLSANSTFGFSAEGADIATKFRDNGSACNTGSSDTANSCWVGLTTSAQLIAGKTSSNHPSGTATTLKFRAESGASHIQTAGTYTATTTVTALPL